MADVAIYVQARYNKKAYKRESYNIRIWCGIEMLHDRLIRDGIDVGYCGRDTVGGHKIILVSITSSIDWYSFIAERLLWAKGNYTVVIGGAGVYNIRPFLDYADVFVFGRTEEIITPLVKSILSKNRYEHSSVCYATEFSMDKEYVINQAERCYQYLYRTARGESWQEQSIGCKRKCLFCQYTWTRRHVTEIERDGVYNTSRANVNEGTIFDFDISRPEDWSKGNKSYIIVGVDGSSERLRFLMNKPISDDLLCEFIVASVRVPRLYRVKMFNIVGLPTETEADWHALVDVFKRADKQIRSTVDDREFYVFEIVNNHFSAQACTPLAISSGEYTDLRWKPADTVRVTPSEYRHKVFDGDHIRLLYMYSTETLPVVALCYAVMRGTELDAKPIRQIAMSKKFWGANTATRLATVEKYLDVDRLFRGYTWEELPTRYLGTYVSQHKMERLAAARFRKYGNSN